jgi:GT2 family glycosyltransferase
MLRVQTFRELGGYRAYFRHMGEEQDFSLRVYGEGYRVVLFPDVTVIHTETQTARSWERISFFGARNLLLCWLLNLPFPLCLWWCARSVRGLILDIFAGRRRFRATLHGILESGRFFWSHRMDRRPLSSVSLRKYFSIDEPRFE